MTKLLLKSMVAAALMVAMTPMNAHAVKAVQTGYLQDYARLGHVGGVPVEQVWIDPKFDVNNFSTLFVTPVQVDPGSTRNPQSLASAQQLAKLLQNDMVERFKTAEVFNVVSDKSFMKKGDQSELVLQTRITILDNGGGLRKWFGMSVKTPTVQLEGKFFDARYKRTYMEFADRRMNTGNIPLLGICNSKDSDVLNGISLKNISKALVDLVAYTKENEPFASRTPVQSKRLQ